MVERQVGNPRILFFKFRCDAIRESNEAALTSTPPRRYMLRLFCISSNNKLKLFEISANNMWLAALKLICVIKMFFYLISTSLGSQQTSINEQNLAV